MPSILDIATDAYRAWCAYIETHTAQQAPSLDEFVEGSSFDGCTMCFRWDGRYVRVDPDGTIIFGRPDGTPVYFYRREVIPLDAPHPE